ncbi:MAG: ComEA family DNA-binding protein [bacterium]
MNLIKSTIFAAALFASQVFAAVNINTADAQQLADNIKGVGLAKAEAIVAYRNENGPFKSIEDLVMVKGIGLKTVEKNRDNLTASKKGKK